MALVTHQMQGSCATFPSRPVSCNRGMEFKRFVTSLNMVVKTNRFVALRSNSCLSVGAPLVWGPTKKSLRILSFKGGAQNDESGGRTDGSKPAKNSVKLSYVQGSEESLTESSKMQDVPLSYASEADERIAGSLAIQNLFKKWLTLLRTQPLNQVVDETLEGLDLGKISIMQNETRKKGGEILKAIWSYFWSLDARVRISLMILISSYLAVSVAYGAEVSRELTPLWISGPFCVTLFIRMLRGLRANVFAVMQTVEYMKNLATTCFAVAYNYVAGGKLKEELYTCLWLPVVNSERMKIELQVWAREKYLDCVEWIWPIYCRTSRYLKKSKIL